MKLIYGTCNPGKISSMKRRLKGLPIEIVSLTQAAEEMGIPLSELPGIKETGNSPLENARLKAKSYYDFFQQPVFSGDSGLYLWNGRTGNMLPWEEQPGLHVRGTGDKRLSDDELIAHYTGLVRKYGSVLGRFKNGICLVLNRERIYESMEESLWGEKFLLADTPHEKRVEGFPFESIRLEMKSGKYIYDLTDNSQDDTPTDTGYRLFFKNALKIAEYCGQ